MARAGADAFLLTLGSARLAANALGRAGVWLSVDTQPPLLDRIVETALRIGADGIKCMVYPGWDAQPNSVAQLAALATDCARRLTHTNFRRRVFALGHYLGCF